MKQLWRLNDDEELYEIADIIKGCKEVHWMTDHDALNIADKIVTFLKYEKRKFEW